MASGDDLHRLEQAGALVMAARLALRRGQKAEARTKLQQALVLNPNDCSALEAVGDMYLEEGDQEKAIKVFEHGLKFHPRHAQFEEKIALAHLDIEEMRRDQEARQQFVETGEEPPLTELKPQRAVGLSVVMPGAGHFYIEEEERGYAFLVAWIITFLGWYLPLHIGWQYIGEDNKHSFSAALSRLNGFWHFWWVLMCFTFVVVYIAAIFDSLQGIERVKTARRRELGM